MTKCSKQTTRGPCERTARPGSPFCSRHTSDADLATAYRLTDSALKESVEFHAKASLLDISQQIVLMRAIIERRLNMAGDTKADQLSAQAFVAAQLTSLVKMTETLVKLGRESGELMNRSQVEQQNEKFLGLVINVLKEKCPDQHNEIVDAISSRLDEIDNE